MLARLEYFSLYPYMATKPVKKVVKAPVKKKVVKKAVKKPAAKKK